MKPARHIGRLLFYYCPRTTVITACFAAFRLTMQGGWFIIAVRSNEKGTHADDSISQRR